MMNQSNKLFSFHEGTIALLDGFEDRTANVFVPANTEVSPNLSIARDGLSPNEELKDYITRQIEVLKSRIPGHRVLQRCAARLGPDVTALQGEQIDAQYKSNGRMIYQRQSAFLIAPRRALIFSASASRPFDAAFDVLWQGWLASFSPRQDSAA